MGIEPTPPAWKAGALPLSYARIGLLTSIRDMPVGCRSRCDDRLAIACCHVPLF